MTEGATLEGAMVTDHPGEPAIESAIFVDGRGRYELKVYE